MKQLTGDKGRSECRLSIGRVGRRGDRCLKSGGRGRYERECGREDRGGRFALPNVTSKVMRDRHRTSGSNWSIWIFNDRRT